MTGVLGADVLRPLAERYADADAPSETPPEEPHDAVLAMQVVLRVERAEPPRRTPLLEAAAAAAIAVCLDPRAERGGEWHEQVAAWIGARIRKVVRRARGAHWIAAQDVDGVTVLVAGAQALALVPGLVTEVPKQISRLQIEGTELPADDQGAPQPGVPLLWLNPDAGMTLGKSAAQVGHGGMLLAAAAYATGESNRLAGWVAGGFRCAVRTPGSAAWRAAFAATHTVHPAVAWREHRVVAVHDAGYTEVDPGTITVLASWP
ncbi:MAG: peptidyl-tRNA hydrolase [Sciscionella sp.]